MKIVIFDVDNTLVRGHLLVLFFGELFKHLPGLIVPSIRLFLFGGILVFYRIPRLLRRCLQTDNLALLDRGMRLYAYVFYRRLGQLFSVYDVHPTLVRELASKIMQQEGFKKRMHNPGLLALKENLQEHQTVIVLLSGTFEDLIYPFYKWLYAHLEQEGLVMEGRLFALGTHMQELSSYTHVCVGSAKTARLKQFLQQNVPDSSLDTVTKVYTDNGFLADLPLLSIARQGIIVGNASRLHKYLPKSVTTSFLFSPW